MNQEPRDWVGALVVLVGTTAVAVLPPLVRRGRAIRAAAGDVIPSKAWGSAQPVRVERGRTYRTELETNFPVGQLGVAFGDMPDEAATVKVTIEDSEFHFGRTKTAIEIYTGETAGEIEVVATNPLGSKVLKLRIE